MMSLTSLNDAEIPKESVNKAHKRLGTAEKGTINAHH